MSVGDQGGREREGERKREREREREGERERERERGERQRVRKIFQRTKRHNFLFRLLHTFQQKSNLKYYSSTWHFTRVQIKFRLANL